MAKSSKTWTKYDEKVPPIRRICEGLWRREDGIKGWVRKDFYWDSGEAHYNLVEHFSIEGSYIDSPCLGVYNLGHRVYAPEYWRLQQDVPEI